MAAATSKAAPAIANMRGKPRRPPALTRQHSQRCLPPARRKSPVTATAPQGVPVPVDVACDSRRYPVQRVQADSYSYSTILASYLNSIEDRHLFEGEPHRFPIGEPVHRRPLHVMGYRSRWTRPAPRKPASTTEFSRRAANKLGADAIDYNNNRHQLRIGTWTHIIASANRLLSASSLKTWMMRRTTAWPTICCSKATWPTMSTGDGLHPRYSVNAVGAVFTRLDDVRITVTGEEKHQRLTDAQRHRISRREAQDRRRCRSDACTDKDVGSTICFSAN